jgi:1,4-alpha-glucan branching enzyme
VEENEQPRGATMYMDPAERQFGAWRLSDDAVKCPAKFSIFFPDRDKDPQQYQAGGGDYGNPKIKSIHVRGDFESHLGQENWSLDAANQMQLISHPKGWTWTYSTPLDLPEGFYEYRYFVTFENDEVGWVSDPCSRYGGDDVNNQNSAFVIGPSPTSQADPLRASRIPLRDLVVYELNIDDFTDEFRYLGKSFGNRAALDAVCTKLDYLVSLGINAILFLPWTAWGNDLYSWGYTPSQYFSVEHRYTNDPTDPSPNHEIKQLSRLRHLISECHARGIHVIMDGAFNHACPDTASPSTGFPYRGFYQNPNDCPYVGIFGGTFAGLLDLDYHNGCTQEFISDVCFYWMDEFQIDGIRFDNTINYYIKGDTRGLPKLLADIQAHANDPNFTLTIEHIDLSAAQVSNDTCATSYWNNALYGCSFDYLWNWKISQNIVSALDTHAGLNIGKVATTYLSNHDHSHVTWQCGARDNCGSMQWYRTQPYAIALFTAPGTPMIQNGQEFAEDHWIPEDDRGTSRRVKTRPLRWEFLNDPVGAGVFALYQKLIAMRHSHPALRSDNFYPQGWEMWQTEFNPEGYGVDVQKQVVIYHRWEASAAGFDRYIIVLNFHHEDQTVDVPFPASGVWTDLLNSGVSPAVADNWLRNWLVLSNWGNVFYRRD